MAANSERLLSKNLNEGKENDEPTPLQKHAIFFDMNKDGLIYPNETYKGFRAIGCNILVSFIGAIFVNAGLSGKTRPGKGFSPLFPIEIKNIKGGKHGSDTGSFDTEGRFVPEKFEEIFAKHAHTSKDYLTSKEVSEMLKANRQPKDIGGWVGAFGEWRLLYFLCKDKQGHFHKETIRSFYEGSLFYELAEKRASKK